MPDGQGALCHGIRVSVNSLITHKLFPDVETGQREMNNNYNDNKNTCHYWGLSTFVNFHNLKKKVLLFLFHSWRCWNTENLNIFLKVLNPRNTGVRSDENISVERETYVRRFNACTFDGAGWTPANPLSPMSYYLGSLPCPIASMVMSSALNLLLT